MAMRLWSGTADAWWAATGLPRQAAWQNWCLPGVTAVT